LSNLKIGTAAESVFTLKLIEKGVSKEKISLLAMPLGTVSIVWPLVLSKYTAKNNPFMMYLKVQFVRILYILVAVLLVSVTVKFKDVNGDYPISFFAVYIAYMIVSNLISSTAFVSVCSIYSHLADPSIGGTYMVCLFFFSFLIF
jgi:PAT family acetyl-CoA transporter-like MFS transporter 1